MASGAKKGFLGLLVFGIVIGIALWGGFNWTLDLTNTEKFCISCHEMEATPYVELEETVHFTNRTGVRATCPDCHVPRPWIYKIVRIIQASNELYHNFSQVMWIPRRNSRQSAHPHLYRLSQRHCPFVAGGIRSHLEHPRRRLSAVLDPDGALAKSGRMIPAGFLRFWYGLTADRLSGYCILDDKREKSGKQFGINECLT